MAGRCVIVKNGFVSCVYYASLSVRRDGAMFELRLKSEDGSSQAKRSMYLDSLLAELKNRQLAESLIRAFVLHDPSPGELVELFPGFSLNFEKKSKKRRKLRKKQEVSDEGSQGSLPAGS